MLSANCVCTVCRAVLSAVEIVTACEARPELRELLGLPADRLGRGKARFDSVFAPMLRDRARKLSLDDVAAYFARVPAVFTVERPGTGIGVARTLLAAYTESGAGAAKKKSRLHPHWLVWVPSSRKLFHPWGAVRCVFGIMMPCV